MSMTIKAGEGTVIESCIEGGNSEEECDWIMRRTTVIHRPQTQ